MPYLSMALRWMARRSIRHRRHFSTKSHYDTIVVGGGVMGASAAVSIARRGRSCLLIDQFEPGHDQGSSHGDGRIYRLAYRERAYIDMMRLALKGWDELEAATGTTVRAVTGGLDISHAGDKSLEDLAETFEEQGIAYERLDHITCAQRFPQFRLRTDQEAIFQKDSGVLFATTGVRALWQWARQLGCSTVTGMRVTGITSAEQSRDGLVHVTTKSHVYTADRVIAAPGAWVGKMCEWLDLHLPTRVSEELVTYWIQRQDAAKDQVDISYRSMPVFIVWEENGLGPYGYYGLPQIDVQGVKASAHYAGPRVDPDLRPEFTENTASAAATRLREVQESTRSLMSGLFPSLECINGPSESVRCLYTITPDHDFVISKVPGHSSVTLLGGGSGHGFKFGPAIGELGAACALGEQPPVEVPDGMFDAGRFKNLSIDEEERIDQK